MSKVILTQEQVEAIEIAIREYGKDDVLNDHLSDYPDYQNWGNNLEPLNGLEPHILARALYQPDGYEVEPAFKVGDWVTYNDEATDLVGKLVEGEKSKILQVDSSMYKHYQSIPYEYLRHATPEEIKKEKRRRWWKDRDRDIWELHEGDVIKAKEDGLAFDVSSLNEVYLTELSIDELDERYLVICLAETERMRRNE